MTPRHQASRAAVELIKRFEGFRAQAARLPDGRWTIGYGHTRTAREGAGISEADADALLIYDLAAVVTAINEWVLSPLTQNQFDALAAFVFNIGLQNFRRSSVLRRLQEGQHLQAACAMEMWRTADFEGERIVIDALVRRRSAEMALFLTPQDGYIPVPSLVILPRVDEAVAQAAPGRAAQVQASLEGEQAQVQRADTPEPPSASRAAAEAITARLNAILQDSEPDPGAARARAVLPLPAFTPLPPEEEACAAGEDPMVGAAPAPEPEPAAPAATPEPSLAGQGPIVHPAVEVRPIAYAGLHTPRRPPRGFLRRPSSPLVAVAGVAGLGAAGVGIFGGVSAHASERLPDPVATGWGLSLAGAGLMASSVYLLLKRLGAREE